MNTLETTLLNKRNLIGQTYQNLGKSSGSFFSRKKVFLSFDQKKGWEVVSLGRMALLFRAIGFFKSTHLSYITKEWSKLKATTDYKNSLLNNRLKTLWKEKYPSREFPNYFAVFGNCNPKQARIKIFGERHDDQDFRKAIGKKINKKFRQGDLILTEVLSKSKKLKAAQHRQTVFADPNFDIQGWEPEDFEKIHAEIMGDQVKLLKQLEIRQLSLTLKKTSIYFAENVSKERAIDFEEDLNQFIQVYSQLAAFAFPKKIQKKVTQENIKKIRATFQKIKDDSQKKSLWRDFDDFLFKIFEEITVSLEKNCYTNLKPEQIRHIFETFKKRTESLAQEIQRHGLSNSTLFVVSGYNHVVKSIFLPKKQHADVDHLHQTLNQLPFVIYMNRDEFERMRIKTLNKNLNLRIFK